MTDIRHDPLTGRWVAIGPQRASRPGAATPASDAPSGSEPDGLRSDLLAPGLRLLAEVVRRLQRVRGEPLVRLNAWLHDGPHWHLELFPRATRPAGLEPGAGAYINPVAPETAAEKLRAA